MNGTLAFSCNSGRRLSKRDQKLALVAQIVSALEKLGGSAHRDLVINQIAIDQGIVDLADVASLRVRVTEIFHDHCENQDQPISQAPLFRRVFGSNSQRWSLADPMRNPAARGHADLDQIAG